MRHARIQIVPETAHAKGSNARKAVFTRRDAKKRDSLVGPGRVSVCDLPGLEDLLGLFGALDRSSEQLARLVPLAATEQSVRVGARDLALFRQGAVSAL